MTRDPSRAPVFLDLDGDGFDPPGLSGFAAATAGASAALPLQSADASPPPSMYDGLSEEERREVQAHFPIHRLVIPESALQDPRP